MNETTDLTTAQIAARFHELAQQEKWFEIQDECFAEDVRSVEPADSPYLAYLPQAAGKAAVRRKAETFVARIEAVHRAHTTPPVVADRFFSVARLIEFTARDLGRVTIDQIMLYEVKDGRIVLEQFFY